MQHSLQRHRTELSGASSTSSASTPAGAPPCRLFSATHQEHTKPTSQPVIGRQLNLRVFPRAQSSRMKRQRWTAFLRQSHERSDVWTVEPALRLGDLLAAALWEPLT